MEKEKEVMEKEKEETLSDALKRVYEYLLKNSKPLEKEYSDVVNEHFWDLLLK